jgi:hypothetical protein
MRASEQARQQDAQPDRCSSTHSHQLQVTDGTDVSLSGCPTDGLAAMFASAAALDIQACCCHRLLFLLLSRCVAQGTHKYPNLALIARTAQPPGCGFGL